MGGIGSGDYWRWRRKKSTVEQSLVVPMKSFRKRLSIGRAGSLNWSWANGSKASAGFFVTGSDDSLTLTLHYRWKDAEDVRVPVRLTSTPTQFGGPRWWFVCPLFQRDVACNRRVGKLYLPPGAKYFGCRRCHDLTYRSSQHAHARERMIAREYRIDSWLTKLERQYGLAK